MTSVTGDDRGKSVLGPPRTLEEWMNHVGRRLNVLEVAPQGIGVQGWNDVQLGPGFVVQDHRFPGWRRTNDGRVELRGRLRKSSDSDAVNNGDVVMYLPYECAPPNNEQRISAVSVLGPASVLPGNPGFCRYDIQRELAWKEEVQKDPQGNEVIIVVSRVEVIAKPASGPITDWVGFDHAIFDPRLYVDTLPVVPKGEKPLVPNPGIAVVQHPSGRVEFFVPGVKSS